MRVDELMDLVRALLQDRESRQYRYSDADLIALLNRGVEECYRLRPDAFVGLYDQSLPSYATTDITAQTTIDLPAIVVGSLEYYVAGHAELRDDEHVTDGRAATLIADYRRKLIGRA